MLWKVRNLIVTRRGETIFLSENSCDPVRFTLVNL